MASTRVSGWASTMRRVASTPSMRGICMSIRTTSVGVASHTSTASTPSAATPTQVRPGVESIMMRSAPLIRGWSSAMRTRMSSVAAPGCSDMTQG